MTKSILIIVGLALGFFFPAAQSVAFLIRPFLMVLLFFSFLNVRIDAAVFHPRHFLAAALLPPLALAAWWVGSRYSPELGRTLFIIALAPTAVITPVLIALLKRRVAYAIGSILVTHAVLALVLPFLLPYLLGIEMSGRELLRLFTTIGSTIGIPLLVAQLFRWLGGAPLSLLRRLGPYSFALFLFNIFVASAKLSYFLRYEQSVPPAYLLVATLAAGLLCLLLFGLGAVLLPPGLRIEGSLGLGRKNTMLVIWVALTYLTPLATLGPMVYIVWQNILVAVMIGVNARR